MDLPRADSCLDQSSLDRTLVHHRYSFGYLCATFADVRLMRDACLGCGKDTEMYERDKPMCPECSDAQAKERATNAPFKELKFAQT